MRALRVLAVLGIVGGSLAATPQSKHPLAGKWNIEYERGRRMTDGESQSIMGKATLDVITSGDSIIATFTPEAPTDGRPASPPLRLAGTGTGNSASFKTNSTSRVNMNGEERTINVAVTWELKAEGDVLSGTSKREVADMPMVSQPTPVKGTRVK